MTDAVTTLSALLRHQAERRPKQDFLRMPGRFINFAAADVAVDRFAAGLRINGISAGDRVALLMSNSIEQVLVWLAINRIGALHVPLNSTLPNDLLARSLKLVTPKIVIADEEVAQAAADSLASLGSGAVKFVVNGSIHDISGDFATILSLAQLESPGSIAAVQPDPLDPATLLFTSGSTGVPKACVLSHRYLVRAGELHAHYLGLSHDDVLFTPFPLFHIDAATLTVGAALAVGATAALSARFSASRFWDEVRACRATVFNFMGATANILWKQTPSNRDKDHHVRLAWGVPMPTCEPEWKTRFGFPLVEVYGLTDAGLPAYQPLDQPRRAGSCGRIIPEYEIRIADEHGKCLPNGATGEILIRANEPGLLMNEYFGMPEATSKAMQDGWFHTGDIGRLDKDGYLYFLMRGTDVIRRRGENIAATDVEDGVNSYEAVYESAAVGVASELSEDDIKVFVVAKPGAEIVEEQLIQHCRQVLPRYMVPRYIEVVRELPKTPTQKIERRKLASLPLGPGTWEAEVIPK